MYRKSKIKPLSNVMGKVIQRVIAVDANKIMIHLLKAWNLFSKKMRKMRIGKSKKRKFSSNVSIKVVHPFNG